MKFKICLKHSYHNNVLFSQCGAMTFWPVIKMLICSPSFWTAIVDELSEPIKYQSAADKRAAQMTVFGIDEMVRRF